MYRGSPASVLLRSSSRADQIESTREIGWASPCVFAPHFDQMDRLTSDRLAQGESAEFKPSRAASSPLGASGVGALPLGACVGVRGGLTVDVIGLDKGVSGLASGTAVFARGTSGIKPGLCITGFEAYGTGGGGAELWRSNALAEGREAMSLGGLAAFPWDSW